MVCQGVELQRMPWPLSLGVRPMGRMASDNQFSLELLNADSTVHPAIVSVGWATEHKLVVSLRWHIGELSATSYDAFTAFCAVREELADLRLAPRCFGACRNLVLSSMAYQMSGGLKGYLARLGVSAKSSDLVSIFGAGPGMDLATVAEQQEFKLMWLRSLGFSAGAGGASRVSDG